MRKIAVLLGVENCRHGASLYYKLIRDLEFVKGNSNKEIADASNVTEGTVKYHVNSILTKQLGVADRTQAATAALLRGIIHPQDL